MKMAQLLLILFPLILGACSGKRIIKEENTQFTKNEIVNLKLNWLKDKGSKFDFEMSVTNVSEKDIIIYLNDMSCAKGSSIGILKHTFFNTGERTIDFRAGQSKQFKMVCNYGEKTKGDYSLTISRVYDNPSGDGATKGKVIHDKLEWTGHQ